MVNKIDIEEFINKSLFLLGAGFSKPAGCKVSSEMLDDLRIRIQNDNDITFNKIEKESFNFLLSCLSYHCEWRSIQSGGKFKFSPNIEELILLMRRIKDRENYLPYPVTGSWSDKLVKLETDFNSWAIGNNYEINELFSSLEKKIKEKLLIEWLKIDKNKLSYLNPLKEYFQEYPGQVFCLDIFTINYDTVLEKYFNEIGIWTGFSNGKWVGLDSRPNLEDERGRINLYKLHGSLNWIRDEAGEVFEKEKVDAENKTIEQDPFIIFGQGQKTFSVEPFFSLIYYFRQLLKAKEYFFVIGYSFFDPYINNLLISATLGTNKKIIIINSQFGPEELERETNDEFGECANKGYGEILVSYIKEIQKNSFYSELPEFNVSYIKSDSLFYIPFSTQEFISRYFSESGKILIDLVKQFEDEKMKIEHPFE